MAGKKKEGTFVKCFGGHKKKCRERRPFKNNGERTPCVASHNWGSSPGENKESAEKDTGVWRGKKKKKCFKNKTTMQSNYRDRYKIAVGFLGRSQN